MSFCQAHGRRCILLAQQYSVPCLSLSLRVFVPWRIFSPLFFYNTLAAPPFGPVVGLHDVALVAAELTAWACEQTHIITPQFLASTSKVTQAVLANQNRGLLLVLLYSQLRLFRLGQVDDWAPKPSGLYLPPYQLWSFIPTLPIR